MTIALITAGGIGARTGKKVPKQFLTINDIPLIVYTMKNIQDSNCYDGLYIVCNDGWSDFIASYALQYNIDIFKGTIRGGETRFESYYNGLKELIKHYNTSDVVSILDGNRPLTPKSIFVDSVSLITNADCVLPLEPCHDSMYLAGEKEVIKSLDRSILFKGQSPETSLLGKALEVCEQNTKKEGHIDMPLTGLMLMAGMKVAFVEGSSLNFKITTNEDFQIFKSLNGKYGPFTK